MFLIYFSSRNTIPKMQFLPFFIRGPFPNFSMYRKIIGILFPYIEYAVNKSLIFLYGNYIPNFGNSIPNKMKKIGKKNLSIYYFFGEKNKLFLCDALKPNVCIFRKITILYIRNYDPRPTQKN